MELSEMKDKLEKELKNINRKHSYKALTKRKYKVIGLIGSIKFYWHSEKYLKENAHLFDEFRTEEEEVALKKSRQERLEEIYKTYYELFPVKK